MGYKGDAQHSNARLATAGACCLCVVQTPLSCDAERDSESDNQLLLLSRRRDDTVRTSVIRTEPSSHRGGLLVDYNFN